MHYSSAECYRERTSMKSFKCIQTLCLVISVSCVTCELNLPEGSTCVSEGLNGTCVSIYRCPIDAHAYIYRNAGYDDDSVPQLSEICSYKDKTPVTCCTDCTIHDNEKYKDHAVNIQGSLIKKEGPKAYDKCLDYLQYLPYSCRGKKKVKIEKGLAESKECYLMGRKGWQAVGGRSAERWEFPHMALLGYGEEQQSAEWVCGGSVISEKFILTAGHCVSAPSLGQVSFAALGLLKRSDPLEYWQVYKIKRAIKHPEYKPPSKYHDIALLETDTKIIFSQALLPACLDTERLSIDEADASGWGNLGHKNALADTLQVVVLSEFKETECASAYPIHRHLKEGYNHSTQMCFGSYYNITDTCQGDSGGPLQVNEMKCQYTVVGVTSYGKDCGTLGTPGMYTRVSHYVPWIESIVWPN